MFDVIAKICNSFSIHNNIKYPTTMKKWLHIKEINIKLTAYNQELCCSSYKDIRLG